MTTRDPGGTTTAPRGPSRSPVSLLLSRADQFASRPAAVTLMVTAAAAWLIVSVATGFPAGWETVFDTVVAALTLAMVFATSGPLSASSTRSCWPSPAPTTPWSPSSTRPTTSCTPSGTSTGPSARPRSKTGRCPARTTRADNVRGWVVRQPQKDVRVCLDPAGRPFRLYTED